MGTSHQALDRVIGFGRVGTARWPL